MVLDAVPVHRLAVVVAFLAAFGVVWAIDRPRGAWGRRLRSRLLLGVPWGTLLAVAFVVCVYLFVQGGARNPYRPVVIPFRAWSYLYPEGMIWAGFAHANFGHVTGNLLGTLVAGTLAEYAYGHFPHGRGTSSFSSLRRNPYVRAFAFVPAAVFVCGLLTALFALGPVIGFSGVVFAMWGFALVHYPLGAVVALAGSSLVRLLWNAFRNPVIEASAGPSYSAPWWAGIAVQGHALGLFLGVFAGLYVLRHRDERPSGLRLFAGTLLFGASQGLWAVYWYLGNESYRLFRAVGTSLVVVLAVLVAAAGAASAAPLLRRWAVDRPEGFREAARSASPRAVALVVLCLGFGVVVGPAVPVNMMTTTDEPLPGDPVEIEGYEVTYAEDVRDQTVSVIDVEAFNQSTAVNTSGVIVRNPDRHIWTTALTKGRLAQDGAGQVRVGGTGWREDVDVRRAGWRAVGGDPTYRIDLVHDGETRTAFVSEPSEAEATIDGRNVTVAAVEGGFDLRVAAGNETASAALPATNESVVVGGIAFEREDRRLYAERGETRVRIANAERYT
ncbi:rhomboid family intramembrane serine protease [Haloparvum alkalitolerans]|uniref:rhomboid family intramembrane serine protease n=1 Tax=Haloparvum alkalitolerans TaxID=1042953 RepID=UPI003CE9F436